MRYLILIISLAFSASSFAQGYVSQSSSASPVSELIKLTTTAPLGEVCMQNQVGAFIQWGTHANANIWGDVNGIINFGPLIGSVPAGTGYAQAFRAQNFRADNQIQVMTWASITDGATGVAGSLDFSDTDGIRRAPQATLPTLACGGDQNVNTRTGTEVLLEGDATHVTRNCRCSYRGTQTPNYGWRNTDPYDATDNPGGGQFGTTTTCP